MTKPSEGALTEQPSAEQQPAPESGQDRIRAEMFLHVLPVTRQLADFLKKLPHEEIQGDGVAERIARGAATQNPAAIFEHADQIAGLPCAEELFARAASAAPEAAIEHAEAYSAQPYGDKVIEVAMRAASVSAHEVIRKLLFTRADLYAEKPWARELMLKALQAGQKEQRQWEVVNAALTLLRKYEDQPYAEEVIRAALATDGWGPFDYASYYSHLPFAKDILVAAAIQFPWGMFARLQNYIELPWAEEVILAAIHSDRMKKPDWIQALRPHKDVYEKLLKKGFAETVFSALAEKFPDLIFDSQRTMDSEPWGKKILRQAINRAATINPVEAIDHHPAHNIEGRWSSQALDKELMSPQQWEKILELSARSLLQQQPSEVFSRLNVFGDRPFAKEIAVEASSRAPGKALHYIQAYLGHKTPPSYINDMLEPAVRSEVREAPKELVEHILLFVEYPWAEEIMLQLASVSPDLVATALPYFTAKPWANMVMLRAMDTRREAAARLGAPAGVA